MNDNLVLGTTARDKIISGIRKCRDAVGGTMGTGGSNALLQAIESPGHLMTNDGATILESIRFADPLEEMGRKILLEAVSRANKQSGDGSSTTTVLCAAIIEEGLKHLGEASAMEIKRSLEDCIPVIEESIEAQKRTITVDEVGAVAAISAEDTAIGAMLQDIYKEIGPKGIVYWDISKTAHDSYKIGKGITVEGAGYASPYMCDATEQGFANVARLKNAVVLITRQKITTAADFEKLFAQLNAEGKKDVLMFCNEIDQVAITQLVQTRLVRGFRVVAVKMPTLWKDWWYEDLAQATGATVIDPNAGISHANMTSQHLGFITDAVITKEDTFLDGIHDVTAHVAVLEEKNDDESRVRAARLSTRTARYFVGAHTDSALSYRRLKVEDAINAAYHALNGGVVAGGGVALHNTSLLLPAETVGQTILKTALTAPMAQIVTNAGLSADSITRTQPDSLGVDTRSGQTVDMFEAHITDPAVIVTNAAKNAISVAAAILTTNIVVTLPKDDAVQAFRPM